MTWRIRWFLFRLGAREIECRILHRGRWMVYSVYGRVRYWCPVCEHDRKGA